MDVPLPADAPDTPVCVTVHEKVAPVTFPLSVIAVVLPEQIVCVDGVAVTTGIGFTVTVTVIGVPEQPFASGVIVYVAVPGTVPVVESDCAMDVPLPADAPETPDWETVQEKVVPDTLPVSPMDVLLPEQMVCVEGVAVTTGIGLTVTVTVTGVPEQPLAVGVMVYTAVPGELPVADNVCATEVPEPAAPPDTPVCTTVQLNVAVATLLVSAMEVTPPEQSVWDVGVAVTVGTGFTVIVTVIGVPGQPPDVGVIVYTAVPGTVPVVDNVCAIEDPDDAEAPDTPV